MAIRCLWLVLVAGIAPALAEGSDPAAAARGVIQRVLPGREAGFEVEVIPAADGRDIFEVESRDGRIVLRGNNGVSICSGLNWYLKNVCHCQLSWCGSQMNVPDPLPPVPRKVRVATPHRYRYWFNYCAFSYTMAFWDWPRWEWMIDWMALHGINMPLAVTGQEATWQAVGRRYGLSDAQMAEFLPGPAFLPFGWMGCLDGWGGPLGQDWIDRHEQLQRRIVARQRELGMTPVLQGFTGHVPAGLREKFPNATFRALPKWAQFPGTTFIDPADPLFVQVGTAFLEEQTRQFGTDHIYGSDTFIEMSPPSSQPAFLADMGSSVYKAMSTFDPQATWLMQGWIFTNNPQFWQAPQAKALLGAPPDGRLILLEMTPGTWQKTENYYGKPWIWGLIQNFGDTVNMQGNPRRILESLGDAMEGPEAARLLGTGLTMEGLDNNPMIFDLVTDLTWREQMPKLDDWIMEYAHRRYGREDPRMVAAWKLLLDTVYLPQRPRNTWRAGSLVCLRPVLHEPAFQLATYDRAVLARAIDLYLQCAPEHGKTDSYRYDLVNLVRQELADTAAQHYQDLLNAYAAKDAAALSTAGEKLCKTIDNMDVLLGTRREFMLGPWLESAKAWATNDAERKLYEWNARVQITLWGPPEGVLFDYARKQWSGLLVGFHKPRWEQFIAALKESLQAGKPLDSAAFNRQMQQWEDRWTHGTESYPAQPAGDPLEIALRVRPGGRRR